MRRITGEIFAPTHEELAAHFQEGIGAGFLLQAVGHLQPLY